MNLRRPGLVDEGHRNIFGGSERPRRTCVDFGRYRASSEHRSIRPSEHLSPTQSLLLLLPLPRCRRGCDWRWQVQKKRLRGPQMGGGSGRPRETCVDCSRYRASSEHRSIRPSEHLRSTESLLLSALRVAVLDEKRLGRPQMGGGSERPRRTCVDFGRYRASSEYRSIRPSEHLRSTEPVFLLTTSN